MKTYLFAYGIFVSSALFAVPEVGSVRISQDGQRKATITYSLTAPAVVTVDIQTNAVGGAWVSVTKEIGAAAFTGDVWKRVDKMNGAISWNPVATWPGRRLRNGAQLRAVVKAHALDDTPDYMVVDLQAESDARVRYYPSVDLLPGGLLGDNAYRETKLVMRKVTAKDIPWMMGSTCEPQNETSTQYASKAGHAVTLTNDYYLGVFEITHKQWATVCGSLPPVVDGCRFDTDGDRRPIEQAAPNRVRGGHNWPTPPTAGSFLGQLRTRTVCDEFPSGIDFDLPSEAGWEYACRADSVDGEWNTRLRFTRSISWLSVAGTAANRSISDDAPGRYAFNGGYVYDDASSTWTLTGIQTCGLTNGTIEVGSVYPPNAWGFYDMHGNVEEMCLDYYTEDITDLGGRVQNDINKAGKSWNNYTICVCRGGSWRSANSSAMLSSTRSNQVCTGVDGNEKYVYGNGVRVACRAGLK